MKYFIDSVSGERFAFDDECEVSIVDGAPVVAGQDGVTVARLPATAVQVSQAAFDASFPAPPPAALLAISRIEIANPITHRAEREKALGDDFILRALRDKINALDAEVAVLTGRGAQPLPPIPVSYGITVVKQVDDAIKVERAKL